MHALEIQSIGRHPEPGKSGEPAVGSTPSRSNPTDVASAQGFFGSAPRGMNPGNFLGCPTPDTIGRSGTRSRPPIAAPVQSKEWGSQAAPTDLSSTRIARTMHWTDPDRLQTRAAFGRASGQPKWTSRQIGQIRSQHRIRLTCPVSSWSKGQTAHPIAGYGQSSQPLLVLRSTAHRPPSAVHRTQDPTASL